MKNTCLTCVFHGTKAGVDRVEVAEKWYQLSPKWKDVPCIDHLCFAYPGTPHYIKPDRIACKEYKKITYPDVKL